MTNQILQVITVALLAFLLRSIIKFGLFTYKVKLNSLVYLVVGILFTLMPAIISPSTVTIIYIILTSFGLAFILIYFDEKGWMGGKSLAEKKVDKKVIRPKAKPNRVKYLTDAEREKFNKKNKKK